MTRKQPNDFQIDKTVAMNNRVRLCSEGKIPDAKLLAKPVVRVIDGVKLQPCLKELGNRSVIKDKVLPESDRLILDSEIETNDGIKKLEASGVRHHPTLRSGNPSNAPAGMTVTEKSDDANYSYRRLYGIIQPEYNLLEPFTIYDSEPFVRQAINRKISLMFRNGFDISGDQDPDIEYIKRRYEAMEYVMERTTETFFKQILFNLLLNSNCFLQKIRSEKSTIVSKKEGRPEPVAAYLIIPAHMIFPYLENGVPVKWRRFFDTGAPFEDIALEDIVHLKWDVKPGHRFGTPRLVGVRDDIFALRRLEENVELLFINFLFPLFHVAVGNEENPAAYDGESGMSEVDMIRWQIQNMPKEGVFVTDERVKVSAVGAEGKTLDYSKLLEHYKARIFTGLGMSALDMGDSKAAGSRSTGDNISQNLKDSIKSDLESFGGLIRMSMFKEFFLEATYSVSVQRAVARTWIHFHEVDLDNKIKNENHIIQKYLNNLVDEDEARKLMGNRIFSEGQRGKLNFDLHTLRLVKETEKAKAKAAIQIAEASAVLAPPAAKPKKPSTGAGRPQSATEKKSSPAAKSVQNKETPTNQHGSNLGPTKAKSGMEHIAAECTDSLSQLIEDLKDNNGTVDYNSYIEKIGPVLTEVLDRVDREIGASTPTAYTRQARMGLDKLIQLVSTTYDPETISILVGFALESTGDIDARDASEPEPESTS
jgi:hypothetical protein